MQNVVKKLKPPKQRTRRASASLIFKLMIGCFPVLVASSTSPHIKHSASVSAEEDAMVLTDEWAGTVVKKNWVQIELKALAAYQTTTRQTIFKPRGEVTLETTEALRAF